MRALVYRLDQRARLPQRATENSIGYDLFSLEDVKILPGECKLVRTGLVIKAPPPLALFIFPRSSLYLKKGLIMPNSAGIIDFDYCGAKDEIKIPLLNLKKEEAEINAGERIAQIIFLTVGFPEIIELAEPPCQGSRGGFGSSGGYARG